MAGSTKHSGRIAKRIALAPKAPVTEAYRRAVVKAGRRAWVLWDAFPTLFPSTCYVGRRNAATPIHVTIPCRRLPWPEH